MNTYNIWNGTVDCYIDHINIEKNGSYIIGNFGGCSESTAYTNEDGLISCEGEDWRFVVLMDSHTTYESVILLTSLLESKFKDIKTICSKSIESAVPEIQKLIVDLLTSDIASERALSVTGETAALFCLEKEGYLWWLSVGDNSLYLYQKEFNDLGQYRLNQRMFFQWYGQQNSLTLKVPCYTTGSIHLREGEATIVMLTDGVLEIEGRPYENEALLAGEFKNKPLNEAVKKILSEVQRLKGRDSATIVAWRSEGSGGELWPSRL